MKIGKIKDDAIKLRREGFTYAHISRTLNVPKSTLSDWLKTIGFFPNEYSKRQISNSQKKAILTRRADKAMSLHLAHTYADAIVGSLSERDIFILGLGVYIGEGSKSQSTVRIVNSDPRIIRFSILWLKKCFGLRDENIKVRVHCYPDTIKDETLAYWRAELELPESSFQPFYVDLRTSKSSRNNRVLPHGTAHLTVVSNGEKELGVLLHRKILATIDRALETRD